MPKENRIDNHLTDDLNDHLSAVEKSIKKLRKRLKHYFKKDEVVRTRFTAIEKQVLDFSSDCRAEVERIVKGQSAKKTSPKKAAPKVRRKRAKITPEIKDGIVKALNEKNQPPRAQSPRRALKPSVLGRNQTSRVPWFAAQPQPRRQPAGCRQIVVAAAPRTTAPGCQWQAGGRQRKTA